ncbi:FHA domain-containing protein [Paenibacillus sp.]|uniref:FHA domain-containing protein n=1 Tax=Paenibacillus sp. TaxID=58172 RepID=UPI002D436DB7|nr:FHA domain-containing protein [Paenibacillus sp.]HZG88519.1 FHA domain-containing protein [Paenibacillus sp.]
MDIWSLTGLRARIDPTSGPEVVVERPDGIGSSEVTRVQVAMLEHHALAGTLPLRREDTDGSVRLRYGIAGMRRLRAALEADAMRPEHWESFLIALRRAIREGADYCIRSPEYVLDPEWIWVGNDVRDVRLMVVPIVDFGTPERCHAQWQALYDCLVRYGLPPEWKDRLHPSRWHKDTFSHRLWMEAVGHASAADAAPRVSAPDPANAGVISDDDAGFRGLDERYGETSPLHEAGDGDTMRFSVARIGRSEAIRLLVAIVCWIAFAWQPSPPLLLTACLGTVPIGWTLFRRFVPEAEGDSTAAIGKDAAAYDDRLKDEAAVESLPPAPLDSRTLLLSDGERTVMLPPRDPAPSAWIEVRFEQTNRVETVPLLDVPIRFGRGPSGVDVVVDHPAASRVHLEIAEIDATPHAIDLGSTNGTFCLDQLMKPHQPYPLRDGDMLRLPGAVLVLTAARS